MKLHICRGKGGGEGGLELGGMRDSLRKEGKNLKLKLVEVIYIHFFFFRGQGLGQGQRGSRTK